MPTNPAHNELITLLKTQQNQLDRFYAAKAREMAKALKRFKLKNPNAPWQGNKALERKFDKVMLGMDKDFKALMRANMAKGVSLSQAANDKLVKGYIRQAQGTTARHSAYMFRNSNAIGTWVKRRADGLDISGRVWKIDKQTKAQMETYLKAGLADGRPAKKMATDMKQYLREPNKVFRRVRGADGKLQLSKPAKAYKSGRGVYRSSYKNALRFTRTETNLAYRTADHDRIQRLDFVKGIKVNLSNAHPTYDICDELQGIYPKAFSFSGWHPNCICYTTTQLMSKDQFINKMNTGVDRVKPVTRIPARADRYLQDKADKLKGSNNPPYWLIENYKPTKDGLALKKGLGTSRPAKLKYNYSDPDIIDENLAYMDKEGLDTFDAFAADAQFKNSPRSLLRQKWIDRVRAKGSTKTNTIHMTGGAPANGKSTYMESKFSKYPDGLMTIDTDKIKKMIPEYRAMEGRRDMRAAAWAHKESSAVSKEAMRQSVAAKEDFLLDGVGGWKNGDLAKKINIMRDKGRNRIIANYVTLDTDLSLKIAKKRAFATAREVDYDYVRLMNKSMPDTIEKILQNNLMDEMYLWDTNQFGKPPRLILTLIDGKVTIHNEALYTNFKNKAFWKPTK